MLAHKAVHEGHVAAEAAAGQKSYLDARVIPRWRIPIRRFRWAGLTEEEAKRNRGVKSGLRNFLGCLGRAIANGRDEASQADLLRETHP